MDVVDVNILLYALEPGVPRHAEAHAWLQAALNRPGAVGFTWLVIVGFVRIATHESIWPDPLTISEATDVAAEWLDAPGSVVLEPTARHLAVVRGLVLETGSAGNLTNDAHLAAIAIEHGAAVCTFDNDFGRFPGLRWHRPGE